MAVFDKEFADHFGSRRFLIFFALICVASLSSTYIAADAIRAAVLSRSDNAAFNFLRLFTVSNGTLPPLISWVEFLGPLVGIALGFDAINSEKSNGTLGRVLAQPIYRDAVINGKFLARLATIAIMLLSIILIVSGLGLRITGFIPAVDEVARVLLFVLVSVIYVAFWMALSILFSIIFRQAATSALAGIATWIFFAVFLPMIASLAAEVIIPASAASPAATQAAQQELGLMLDRLSPDTLYQEATIVVLVPEIRTLGILMPNQKANMLPTPLSVTESLLVIWPQVVGLIGLTAVCFGISYTIFLKEEIRA